MPIPVSTTSNTASPSCCLARARTRPRSGVYFNGLAGERQAAGFGLGQQQRLLD
ncbi:MAG: hypothetical protein ACXVRW_12245 [Solirubrobacteraceae bacterium]